jgi:hypothetical protein
MPWTPALSGQLDVWIHGQHHSRRRPPEGCGGNARRRELGCSCRAASWSNEKAVAPRIDRTAPRTGRCTTEEDNKLQGAADKYGGAGIGMHLPRWIRVEREGNVGIDGTMPWTPVLAWLWNVRVAGQQTKTAS